MPGPYTVGMFTNLKKNDPEKILRKTAFLEGLISVDPVKLKSTQVITRDADGDFVTERPRYTKSAQELRDVKVDLYFTSCRPTARHIFEVNQGAANPKPIVIAGAFHAEAFSPVGFGYKEVGWISYDITFVQDWVHLFHKIPKMPAAPKVAVIGDTRNNLNENPGAKAFCDAIRAAMPGGNVTHVQGAPVNPNIQNDLRGKDGVIVLGLTNNAERREELIGIVKALGIPALYPNRFYVTSGGLISCGVKLLSLYREAGILAGKLLAPPSSSPPPKLTLADDTYREVTLNLKTAKALGYAPADLDALKMEANIVFADDD